MGLADKTFDDIFSCFDTIHECKKERQTDGHRTTANASLCRASRGKMICILNIRLIMRS